MATSILSLGGPAVRRGRDPTRRTLGTPRGLTNGAPCLGLALVAGGLGWGLLGSVLVFLLP